MLLLALVGLITAATAKADILPLSQNWFIQDSTLVPATHAVVGNTGFATDSWFRTQVPSTLLGALSTSYRDVFVGTNLLKLPGTGPYYPIGKDYSSLPTPPESPFGRPWWYRTEFVVPLDYNQKSVELVFRGITNGAEIWLNGTKLANVSDTEGTYRTHRFPVSSLLKIGQQNALAVLVHSPQPEDLTATWVDWNPTPPDKNMGLWREVYLESHGPIAIAHPQVLTKLVKGETDLTVEAELTNATGAAASGVFEGEIEGIHFSQNVELAPNETRVVSFTVADFPQLHLSSPRLWWPVQMGEPNLYPLRLSFVVGGAVSDQKQIEFGIREVKSVLTKEGSRLFIVNGKPIQIRGGGWSSDLFLRFSRERVEQELTYVKDLGLNTIRLEGRFEPEEFLKLTDRNGILVMPGWVCCNAWQNNKTWPRKNFAIAAASLRDQIYEFRAHPSAFVFLYGSDEAPPEKLEKLYLKTFADYHWPNPVLASANDSNSKVSGQTGVKMNGPYDYVPPSYWYVDTDHGGAFGFNTETSPGAAVPPIESLREFIPADHLWPIDEVWNFHAGENEFKDIHLFQEALDRRYGPSQSVDEFALKSQVMAYDNERAMFEAYGRNKYHSATGIIQWMLNNAWPSLIWHLYDYYLRPGGSYFGAKKANEPLHLQYSYDDDSIVLVNHSYETVEGLAADIQVFDFAMHPLFSQYLDGLAIKADSSKRVLKLPALHPTSKLYFVRLALRHGQGVSHNFYWLSTDKEDFDWDKTDFTHTPVKSEADLRELSALPPASVKVSASFAENSGTVDVENTSSVLAFFTHLSVRQGEREILPVLWSDNYISLLPGEKRVLHLRWPGLRLHSGEPLTVHADGWNIRAF